MSDGTKVERDFVVRSELGLHARPAGRLASVAGRFQSEVSLGRGEEWVSGSSVLSILCLAATRGTVLRVRAIGVDAEQAVMEVGALIESDDV
ncbi:MAG: HPr family phosphocarrier protein [Spirochaetaceae bacterium]|nr:HPr family phosphocarrier protein [Myxococcales bacterium]MCB9726158.1 HPr family phosphocarrier protein [Spirochaetaceae bacterium]